MGKDFDKKFLTLSFLLTAIQSYQIKDPAS